MNLARTTALLLLATWAAAQDVEPTSARAIRSLVTELVSELPYRVPNGEALAIDVAPSSDKNVVGAFTAALVESGFRVQSASIGAVGDQHAELAPGEVGRAVLDDAERR